MNTNTVSFWDPVPSLKVKTSSTMPKKVNVKAADVQVITVNADRDLFGPIIITSNTRQINLMDVLLYLRYELPPVPCAGTHQDRDSLWKTSSVPSTIIEKEGNVFPQLLVSARQTVYSVHTEWHGNSAHGQVYRSKHVWWSLLKYFDILRAPLFPGNYSCFEAHIGFD